MQYGEDKCFKIAIAIPLYLFLHARYYFGPILSLIRKDKRIKERMPRRKTP